MYVLNNKKITTSDNSKFTIIKYTKQAKFFQ